MPYFFIYVVSKYFGSIVYPTIFFLRLNYIFVCKHEKILTFVYISVPLFATFVLRIVNVSKWTEAYVWEDCQTVQLLYVKQWNGLCHVPRHEPDHDKINGWMVSSVGWTLFYPKRVRWSLMLMRKSWIHLTSELRRYWKNIQRMFEKIVLSHLLISIPRALIKPVT